jgi:hypothetical protein
LRRSGTITTAAATRIVLFGLPARLATFGRGVTTFLKELLVGSGEGKILPTVAAC